MKFPVGLSKRLSIAAACLLIGIALFSSSGSVSAFKVPIHENLVTESYPFMLQSILEEIRSGDAIQDVYQLNPEFHFDNCEFSAGVTDINNRYLGAVLPLVNPGSPNYPLAAKEYGKLLHGAQDFYSHSNWVESGRRNLLDNGLGLWHVPTPWGVESTLFVIEGTTVPAGWTVLYNATTKIVYATNIAGDTRQGLVSGTFLTNGNCPDDTLGNPPMEHGGDDPADPGLNKDAPGRPNHLAARTLAAQQTVHEWCRLLHLTKGRWGSAGVNGLLMAWTGNMIDRAGCFPPVIRPSHRPAVAPIDSGFPEGQPAR